MTNPDIVVVGQLGKTHGVQGWLKIHSFTNPPQNLLGYQPWLLHCQKQWQPFPLEATKQFGSQLLVKLSDINTPEAAKYYTNCQIGIYTHQLPEPAEGEYYWHQLTGLSVINQDNITLGVVDRLFETGANDVVVVTGKKRLLLPYIPSVITKVDLANNILHVNWDENF